ncbi:hypothetical protein ACIP2X_18755 [Streptomyces sp. NPDC089424]|uniref:hypothetical protein n=1 Tax=Streptomyces sp. NPDC089424 TaxID=3365917 RepID=UPI0038000A75
MNQRRRHPQEAQILALIDKGLNNAAIGELLFCGPRAVRRVRLDNDRPLAPRDSWRHAHPKEREIRQLLADDLTDAEISRRTGATPETVAERRRLMGLGPAPVPKAKSRPHPREAEILAALKAGGPTGSNSAIARELGVDKQAVSRIRRTHGMPNTYERHRAERPPVEDVWREHVREVDGDHLEWTGPRATNTSGTPILRLFGSWYSAAGIAFRIRTGRDPQGQVRAECDVKHCVAPACVEDEPGRQGLRLTLRRIQGLPDPPTGNCPNGHDLTVDGRLDAALHPYCEGCKRDTRPAKKQATNST